MIDISYCWPLWCPLLGRPGRGPSTAECSVIQGYQTSTEYRSYYIKVFQGRPDAEGVSCNSLILAGHGAIAGTIGVKGHLVTVCA